MKLPSPEKKPGLLERMWIAIWGLTPLQFRRMSLLSSLYASLTDCAEDDEDRLNQVNDFLGLTRDVKCMQFSVLVAPLVWRRVLPLDRIDRDRLDVYINRLVTTVPCWLRYGEDDQLRSDIHELMWYCYTEKDVNDIIAD